MKFDLSPFINDVRLAVSKLIISAENLFQSIISSELDKLAYEKACQQHRDDIWIEKKGHAYVTSHTQQDVEETTQSILTGWRITAGQDFLSALTHFFKTIDLNRLTLTVHTTEVN